MKKRVVSLLLCLIMVLSAFLTGCAEKTDEEAMEQVNEEASVNNITLSMWVVSEKAVSAETAAAVTAALNEITEEQLKTRLAVNFYTKEQYEKKLTAAIKAFDPTAVAPSTETTDSSNTNADGSFYDPKYPALLANQVDIVYIEGEEMYTTFVENGWLASLETELASSANKPMQEYISSVMLEAAKYNGRNVYAIPNNNLIGQYTYMLINRDLVAEIGGGSEADEQFGGLVADVKKINTLFDDRVYSYLDYVDKMQKAAGSDDIVLIDGTYEECLELLAHYWSFDAESYELLKDFSVFGHLYTDKAAIDRGSIELGYSNLFANEAFVDAFLALNQFKAKGYFGDAEAEGKDAAIKIVKCHNTDLEQYVEDYHGVIVAYPEVTEEEIFNNGMFGVFSKSVSVPRSMEIITYINTNAQFRNTLLYGVKGVHYDTMEREVDGENYTVAYKITDDYSMSMAKTGNRFLIFPLVDLENEENSMKPNEWDAYKVQNYDALINPTQGFKLSAQPLNKELAAYLYALNEDLVAIIAEVQSGDDWYANMEVLVTEIGKLLDPDSILTVEDFDLLKDYLTSDEFKNLTTKKDGDNVVGTNDLTALRKNLKKAMSKDAQTVGGQTVYSPYGAYIQWITVAGLTVKK